MALNLDVVDTAINEILESGQSFTLDGVTYNRANVQSLIDLRETAANSEGRTGGTRPTMRAVNFGGMGY
jgi:hypothetical protein